VKRENRLTHSTDFERVRHYGKSYAHPLILLQVAKRDDDGLKAGIVVSRAIGSAVIRNRTKRRVRECLSELIPRIHTGWDLVLVPRRQITIASYEEIKTVCLGLLIKAELIGFSEALN
jgi:ribonuclease P protein component